MRLCGEGQTRCRSNGGWRIPQKNRGTALKCMKTIEGRVYNSSACAARTWETKRSSAAPKDLKFRRASLKLNLPFTVPRISSASLSSCPSSCHQQTSQSSKASGLEMVLNPQHRQRAAMEVGALILLADARLQRKLLIFRGKRACLYTAFGTVTMVMTAFSIENGGVRTREDTADLAALNRMVAGCQLCPRLRSYCAAVGESKRRAYREWEYWAKPVPSFGDERARVLILGLAPGAHGSNRTGRPFTEMARETSSIRCFTRRVLLLNLSPLPALTA